MKRFVVLNAHESMSQGLLVRLLGLGHEVVAVCENPEGDRDLWQMELDYPDRCQILTETDPYSSKAFDVLVLPWRRLPEDEKVDDFLLKTLNHYRDHFSGQSRPSFYVIGPQELAASLASLRKKIPDIQLFFLLSGAKEVLVNPFEGHALPWDQAVSLCEVLTRDA